MDKVFQTLRALNDAAMESNLTDLDKNDTLLNIRDLQQEIYERFIITSKPQTND